MVSFFKRLAEAVWATYHAHRGEVLAACAVVLWAAVIGATNLDSGFGWMADAVFAAMVVVFALPAAALLIALLLSLLRRLPPLLTGFLVAAGAFVSLLWFSRAGAVMAGLLLLVECSLGGALAFVSSGRWGNAALLKRILAISLLLVTLAANVGIFRLLHSDGIDEDLLQMKQKQSALPAPLAVSDPSKAGAYSVKTLYYGSGDSLRRPEFGASVAIRTHSVDASAFFKEFDGWKAAIRKHYWGFGMDKLPLNGHVFYPDGAGPFPLFLIVHGNHNMSVASDEGYSYLCELLASRGFIAVSVDENFLNSGLFHDPPKQQAVRGWLLLEHLKLWHEWAKEQGNPFFGKADLERIALGGHSRGGEAAATAALFNKLAYYPDDANIRFHYGYSIRSVVSIAPADGQYKPAEQPRILKDVNYLVMQGANDSDVSVFMGSRQYDHVRFSGSVPAFKAELYIYRANHGQFNTMWGRRDIDTPANWLLNLKPLLSGDEQRRIAKVYVAAFLEATLHDRHEYEELFRDYRSGRRWTPDTLYVNRFADESYQPICNFDEDADVTTTTAPGGLISANGLTVWREGKIPFREGSRDYNGVFLGWNWQKAGKPPANPPSYSIDLPPGVNLPALALSVAATDDDAPEPQNKNAKPSDDVEEKDGTTNFSVEAMSANGARARVAASAFMMVLPPLHVEFTKLERLDRELYKNSAEPVFQTIRIPFDAFHKANAAFDAEHVKSVRLVFDKTPSRVIIISGVGLSK